MFGEIAGKKVFPIFIAISAYGAVCAMVFSASRVIYSASKANLLPGSKFIGVMHPRLKTPVRALLINFFFATLLILAPPPGHAFEFLVDLVGYPTWVFYGLSVVGLLILRKTRPDLNRPFKVWIPVAILFIATSIFLSIFPFMYRHEEHFPYYLPPLFGVIFIISGIPVWAIFVRGKTTSLDFDMHGNH